MNAFGKIYTDSFWNLRRPLYICLQPAPIQYSSMLVFTIYTLYIHNCYSLICSCPRKWSVHAQREYVNMNKVQLYVCSQLHDLLPNKTKFAGILGENTYLIRSKSCQPLLGHEPSKSHSFSSFFLLFTHLQKTSII